MKYLVLSLDALLSHFDRLAESLPAVRVQLRPGITAEVPSNKRGIFLGFDEAFLTESGATAMLYLHADGSFSRLTVQSYNDAKGDWVCDLSTIDAVSADSLRNTDGNLLRIRVLSLLNRVAFPAPAPADVSTPRASA